MVRATLLTILLAGCGSELMRHDVRIRAVVTEIEIDTLSQLGLLLEDPENAELRMRFEDGLELLRCDATTPPVIVLDAVEQDGRGFGRMQFVLASVVGSEDPCVERATLRTEPISLLPEYSVSGPAVIEGLSVEARTPIGKLQMGSFHFLPEWWVITARHTRVETLRRNVALSGLDEGEASSLWYASDLASVIGEDGRSTLDVLVSQGAQPQVDVDGDTLEELEDTDGDGRVDLCRDRSRPAGQGGPDIVGEDCMLDPDIADAYEIRVRYLLNSEITLEP